MLVIDKKKKKKKKKKSRLHIFRYKERRLYLYPRGFTKLKNT